MAVRPIITALAQALMAGDPVPRKAAARVAGVVGKPRRWVAGLAARYAASVKGRTRPRQRDVVAFLQNDPARRHFTRLRVHQWIQPVHQMQPVAAAAGWDVPAIVTIGDLAEWLSLSVGELEWFADLKSLNERAGSARLKHYHYRVLAKPSGAIRLIEAPKQRLKQIQRQILERILNRIPSHAAVHGFRPGRSIRTFAAPHSGQCIVLKMDLADFFPSLNAGRIQTLFRVMGYPEPVADLLGGLCTNAVPRPVWAGTAVPARSVIDARQLYKRPHLPQGAPTSPALANLCAYRADCRLDGLAKAAGAVYTRYADDLAFSGGEEFARSIGRFPAHAAAILLEEGFSVNHRKTRVMRQGVRQHLAGLTINEAPHVSRKEIERLEAILTNCVRHGPAGQNRDHHGDFRAHLAGRVGFVEMIDPSRGRRLREVFDRIAWG